jgi:hypothetical protein
MKLGRRLVLLPLMFCSASAQNPQLRTYSDPNGTYEFRYPASFVVCTPPKTNNKFWNPASCQAFTPVCPTMNQDIRNAACIAYPATRYAGTNFEAAAFSVSERPSLKTARQCRNQFEQEGTSPVHTRTIGNARFTYIPVNGVATGHYQDGFLYRSFHDGRCHELAGRVASTSFGNHEPGSMQEFKDARRVQRELMKILLSFRFLEHKTAAK